MTPTAEHHDVNRNLVRNLRVLLELEPLVGPMVLSRDIVECATKALDLADRKISILEDTVQQLSGVVRNILELDPKLASEPNVARGFQILDKLDQAVQ